MDIVVRQCSIREADLGAIEQTALSRWDRSALIRFDEQELSQHGVLEARQLGGEQAEMPLLGLLNVVLGGRDAHFAPLYGKAHATCPWKKDRTDLRDLEANEVMPVSLRHG